MVLGVEVGITAVLLQTYDSTGAPTGGRALPRADYTWSGSTTKILTIDGVNTSLATAFSLTWTI